jgi:hypothetical protein
MTNYAPTTAAGQFRRRCRYLGIRVPLDSAPAVEILEQDVVRLLDATTGQINGEVVLRDLGTCQSGAFDPSESFEVRDPTTDATTGDTATVAQAFQLIYSWVRHKQTLRDGTGE